MTMHSRLLSPILLVAAGLVLCGYGYFGLHQTGSLAPDHNPLAVQGSAYGKLLARLSETTIDRVWHLGVEQVVPHYMTGDHDDHDHDEHGHCQHGHCQHGHCQHAHDHLIKKKAPVAATGSGSWIRDGKQWIHHRVIGQYQRTNRHATSPAHLASIYRRIESMLLRSFKFDPTHYGAYDSYHLFLTTSDFGGTPIATEQTKRIAHIAINAAEHENEDPEPWLTAAAAFMNLYLVETAPYNIKSEPIPFDIVKRYRDDIGHCLQRFAEIQAESERVGNWQMLSQARQMEISGRNLFAKRTHEQFDALIARREAPNPPAAEEALSTVKGEK